jgi:hypothetical protein
MADKKPEAPACQFNIGVDCSMQQKPCANCGWNPAVAKKRLAKYYADNGIRVQTEKED